MGPIRKILIVGGGSAGWMSAAYLNRALNLENNRVEITLVESDEVPTIGVGEATIPIIQQYFAFLGIPEQRWMEACNATYKLAIKFDKWYDNEADDSYWHTFGSLQNNFAGRFSLMHHWLHNWKTGKTDLPFAKAVHEIVYLCEAQKSPKKVFTQRNPNIPYAFHLDAGLLATLLKKYSTNQGVKHQSGTVSKVIKKENGDIDHVLLDGSEVKMEADLFIDCTGFKSLLLEKSLEAKYVSYADHLICDRAIAIGTKYQEDDPYNEKRDGLNPFTTATAMSSGWKWDTPLVTRGGNGYVYSSNFQSAEEAEQEFRSALAGKGELTEARHIPIKTGTMEKHWVNNCVGIGLAAGFIEPMESTGLALIQIALENLIYNFPDKNFNEHHRKSFNEVMERYNTNIRDFIILHYTLTQREDTPFWNAIKKDVPIPDTLKEKLETWKYMWRDTVDERQMFGMYNYVSVLAGMHFLPERSLPLLESYLIENTYARFQSISGKGELLAKQMPTQAEYYKQIKRIKEYRASTF